MGRRRTGRRWACWLCLGLACAGAGCSGKDADCLARVCGKTAAKLDGVTGGARRRLGDGWQAVRGSVGEATLNSRVAVRLRWDKGLAGAEVRVETPSPGLVRLSGTVADLTQRRRAVELAQSTQGVEHVRDDLTVLADDAKR